MKKLFYSHLIIIEEIETVLDTHGVSQKEKEDALALIHETLHHEILTHVLSFLPRTHHTAFLLKLESAPHDPALLTFLSTHTGRDIEKDILKKANSVKKLLVTDIKKHAQK